MRILYPENPRFPPEGSSAEGKSGPKARLKSVVDGQRVNIPVLIKDCGGGRRRFSISRMMVTGVKPRGYEERRKRSELSAESKELRLWSNTNHTS